MTESRTTVEVTIKYTKKIILYKNWFFKVGYIRTTNNPISYPFNQLMPISHS